ncbi:response regulator [Enterococcus mediterraneensis]|uniref:response regulator n=1 Tax=Enterococcus mediterraneensis TaxID=2364791 RepID=UPI000F063370|nr:response regulator [Enterococcus mediterraneensis]
MYNVFLVEDEHLIRASLKKQIKNLETTLPISFVGEAGDGETALPLILETKPDILLTDIRMPFMDGIELSQEIKKIMPHIRIIFISGFDEFTYAKAAIQLQADDYLLKPIKPEELEKTLIKTLANLEEKNGTIRQKDKEAETLSQEVKKNLFLNLLFKNQLSLTEAIKNAQELSCSIVGKKYAVLLAANYMNKNFEDYYIFRESLGSRFDDDPEIVFSTVSSRFIKILVLNKEPHQLMDKAEDVAQFLAKTVVNKDGSKIFITIGQPVERISEIQESYRTAKNLLEFSRIDFSPNVLSYKYLDTIRNNSFLDINLKERIAELSVSEIPELIQGLTNNQRLKKEQQPAFRYFVLNELNAIVKQIKQDFPPSALTEETDLLADIAADVEKYKNYLTTILYILKEPQIHPEMSKYKQIIQQSIIYIDNNFSNPEISLNNVADYINLSSSHFSTIFSQALGQTFIEYLTNRRISESKKLLRTTDWKLAVIASEVGYNDPNYFSYLFKRKEGISPSDYRKQ